jgi:gentisate 1,2-dioxygenase
MSTEWSQTVKPYLWKGEEIIQALNWSGELITTGEAGRRTIQMRNPGLSAGMTNTVHISVQLVKPGEIAAAHRHTAAAIRFIVKGTPNAYTIVEGERFPMFEGDFITTPNWTWHDHFNGSNEPVMWLDGLDVRLVTHFGAMIQENFKKDQQPIERPDNFSSKVFTHARPSWSKFIPSAGLHVIREEERRQALKKVRRPYDGVPGGNRAGGGHTLSVPARSTAPPGEKTKTHRHTSTVYTFRAY